MISAIKRLFAKPKQYTPEQISRLYQLATQDTKTALYNARYFETEMQREIVIANRYKRPLSLALVDLDNFKQINKKYGYRIADVFLKKVAGIILSSIRSSDTAARFGGEEFTIILPETKEHEAEQMAERLREAVVLDKTLKEHGVTISIGISSKASAGNAERDELFDKANTALEYSKLHGKNRTTLYNNIKGLPGLKKTPHLS